MPGCRRGRLQLVADAIELCGRVDEQLVRQVLSNLFSNAIEYTPAGGAMNVSVTQIEDSVHWSVSDNGIGVPQSAQAQLFEKFFRGANVGVLETEGTGLGLYLARLIVEQFRGHLSCESEEGHGATFLFTLPAQES